MKLLLDECIPLRLKESFTSHDCNTVSDLGWAGKKNGELLTLAEQAGIEVFLTIDRGIEYQQNLTSRNVAIVLVRAKSNRLEDLQPFIPEIMKRLESLKPWNLAKIG